jgi:hypothetical protein
LLHDWVSDPKMIIIHNHHNVPLLCSCGNDLAIMLKTGCTTLRWGTLSIIGA